MQIILASAKIMNVSIKREQSKLVCSVEREKRGMKSNDRSATKGDAFFASKASQAPSGQSKKVKSSHDVSLSLPRFQNEAGAFARDMAQYSVETIADMLGCSQQIAAQNRLRYMRFFEDAPKLPAILAYHGQAYKHLKAETLNVDDLNYSREP